MNKKQIIEKIVNDLPTRDMRGEMTKEEWYGWFEECWDKAINYTRSCKSDSNQLPIKEKLNFEAWLEFRKIDKLSDGAYRWEGSLYTEYHVKSVYETYLK